MEENSTNTKIKKRKSKYQRALARRKFINSIMGVIIFCGLLGCLSGFSILKIIVDKSDVVLNKSDLTSSDASLIYDDEGTQIQMIGSESRISVSYYQMPEDLIDAFVAVEDSRFFEHNGFDIPRFAKAFLVNIRTLSFAQGGSTITMQVIKNTYFAVDTIAATDKHGGIPRKVQEIYYSMQITEMVSKEKILEMYINKVNYGASTRGVQVAAQYYFGKNVEELNLVECAMLAGVVNAPNDFNPYYNLKSCQERTQEVLYLMNYHGYINDEEYAIAKTVKIENLLNGKSMANANYLEEEDGTIDYQAYIDVVLNELEDVYGIDPYSTAVRVYTGMNKTVQEKCDDIARGKVITFKDKNINISTVVIQNYTGLIVGVCGGRNYNAQRIYNYAYDSRISPGSTSKVMFTYPLAFEYCGISTSYTFLDEPIYWAGTSIRINNDARTYEGEVSIQQALPLSYNTPSVKLYRWLEEKVGTDVMRKYLTSIGYDSSMVEYMNEQYAIGCNGYEVSPIQMAAVESMILSGGLYSEPHTITRIEFINSDEEPIIVEPKQTRVLSTGAAWLTAYLEKIGVNGGTEDDYYANARLTRIKRSSYTVYGKTGTNGYDVEIIKKWGYTNPSDKELLYVWGTNDYAFSLWYGYDTGRYQDKTTYISYSYAHQMKDVPVVNALLDVVYKAYGKPKHTYSMPSDVTSITHIKGLYPYTAAPEGTASKYITTGYVLKSFANVQTYQHVSTIESINDFNAIYDKDSKVLTCSWAEYPDANALKVDSKTLKMTSGGTTWSGIRRYSQTWIDGCVNYFVDIIDESGNLVKSYNVANSTATFSIELEPGTYTIRGYYAYTIYKQTQSNVIEKTIKIAKPIVPVDPEPDPDPTPEVPID